MTRYPRTSFLWSAEGSHLTGNLAIGFVALSYNGTLPIAIRAD